MLFRSHLSPEEDTAKPVVSVAIFPEHTNCTTKIRTGLLETDDDNAISLDLSADTIFSDRVYLKRWKDPDKADDRHNEVKEELESAKCYRIELSEKLCITTNDERCTSKKRNDLLGPELTPEPVTSCLGVLVPSTQNLRPRALRRETSSVEPQLSFMKAFGL